MNTDSNQCDAGLVFLCSRANDITDYSQAALVALEIAQQRIHSVNVLSAHSAAISTGNYRVNLTLPETPAPASHVDRIRRVNEMSLGRSSAPECSLSNDETVLKISVIPMTSTDEVSEDCVPSTQLDQALLAGVLCHMIQEFQPHFVQWLMPEALVVAKDFVRAATKVSPRRGVSKQVQQPSPHQRPMLQQLPTRQEPIASAIAPTAHIFGNPSFSMRFPDVEKTSLSIATEFDRLINRSTSNAGLHPLAEQELSKVFAIEEDESAADPNILNARDPSATAARLATWAVVLTVGIFALPVGAFLVICNLFRGEDFRLAAHSLALTGLLTVLNASGAMAHALQGLVG